MIKSQKSLFMTAAVLLIFLLSCTASNIQGAITSTTVDTIEHQPTQIKKDDAVITCYVGGMPQTKVMPAESAVHLQELFTTLTNAHAQDPQSPETQALQQQILRYAEQHDLLPAGLSAATVLTTLQRKGQTITSLSRNKQKHAPLYQGTAKELFCNFASAGQGSAFPIIILPRLIPLIMTPIPRLFVGWKTPTGITSCGGLLSQTGFLAYGQQQGIALGFWGIGFSIFLPPINSYGMFGYSLYTKVSADYIEYYPPNNPPKVTAVYPLDKATHVPLSTSELTFHISDLDNDLMSYSVTTNPDIGGDNGNMKMDGTYTIPISGLESLTTYTWIIQVTDGKDTVQKILTFTTEPVAPIITNPLPADAEKDVPMDITHLQFTLKDYQGDLMSYTVETTPFIGSAQATGVHDGTYTVAISGLSLGVTYRWYVNVTDGIYWTRKVFLFETGYPSQYNPFEFGWQYRKQITIDHTLVPENLESFPVLISTIDMDLTNAQTDGSDILFMDGAGVASRLYHELETFHHPSGTLVAFVNLATISSTQDTILYLYYGNPSSINQEYPEKVWNSHFKAVWHLHNSPLGTIYDSTDNNNNATSYGSMGAGNLVEGKVGKCLHFDGVNDYLTAADSVSLKPSAVTILCWLNVATPVSGRSILGKGCTDKWGNKDAVSYGISYITGEMGSNAEKDDNTATIAKDYASVNTWYHVGMTYDTSSTMIHYYQDGIPRDSLTHGQSLRYSTPWDFVFAAGHVGTGSGVNYFANCHIDEVWILDIPLTAGWIATVFNNQNDPLSFLSFGPEESGP